MGILGATIFGNRVVAKFPREWMATREPLEAEPDAAEGAETIDGFAGVLGTGRFEAARAGKEDGEIRFVAADGEKGGLNGEGRMGSRHGVLSRFRSAAASAVNDDVATVGLG